MIFIDYLRFIKARLASNTCFVGPFKSWSDAKAETSGYESKDLLEKIVTKSKDARSKNLFERDSFILDKPEHDFALMVYLYKTLAKEGSVRILDFGGGCGSTYFNNLDLFKEVSDKIEWLIVEQEDLVKLASGQFPPIKFENSLLEALKKKPQISYFSGSLQYVEKYSEILDSINISETEYCIIDRIPLHKEMKEQAFIQKVSKDIAQASYPLWILNEEKISMKLSNFDLQIKNNALDDFTFSSIGRINFFQLVFKNKRLR